MSQNQLDVIFETHRTPKDYAKGYLSYLSQVLLNLDSDAIGNVMSVLDDARVKGNRIFFIGNGGSAATATHFANDFAIGTRFPSQPFKAMSLTDNNAIITAVGNDDGYEQIFVKQLESYMEPGDVLVAISASGNSPNLVKAVEYAISKGNTTVGLTGFAGGKLKELCKHVIHVKTAAGEYGPVEDVHMVMDHLMGTYFYRSVRSSR